MERETKFRLLILLGTTVFASIVLLFVVVQTNLFERVVSAIEPTETGREFYIITDVEFNGKETFWSDKRQVLASTSIGAFVFQKNHVTYEAVDDDDESSITIISYDIMGDRAIIHVGKDHMEDIRTQHAQKFNENIKFKK